MRDYTKYTFFLSILVLGAMIGVSFIPPFSVAGVKFKRTNIISDIYHFGDEASEGTEAQLSRDDLDFVQDMQDAANYAEEGSDSMAAALPVVEPEPVRQDWNLGEGSTPVPSSTENSAVAEGPAQTDFSNVTVIEDYSPGWDIYRFGDLLGSATATRNVRIAFLGDSFIEGDIITADVREQLQTSYGGQGVGFVAVSSVTAEYRPTVKHTFRGWKDYLLANKKNVPEEFRDRFYISGTISTATAASWVQYETTTYRKHIGEVPTVRFFYSSDSASDITFKVNDTHEKTFEADSSGEVRQINVSGGAIKKVRVSVPATKGFVGYGVSLEGSRGILVDNYSIRSSTGLSLFGTSAGINSGFNRMMGYDLIVLQYGLNIMSAEITSYKNYGEQFRNLVYYIKRCFPNAAIIVMGVGDRSMLSNGEFVTMPAVPAMINEQRAIARECGVAFWDTYQAMGGYNSMRRFAEWGWAAKDYTHLSFGGGRKIATELVKAIEYGKLHPYRSESEDADEDDPAIDMEQNEPASTTVNSPVTDIILQPETNPAMGTDWDFNQPDGSDTLLRPEPMAPLLENNIIQDTLPAPLPVPAGLDTGSQVSEAEQPEAETEQPEPEQQDRREYE